MKPARRTDSCHTPVRKQDAAEHQRAEAAEEGERAEVGQRHGAVADHRRLDDGVGVAERAHDQPRARRRAASAKAPTMRALVQPQSEPSTMAATRLATDDREQAGAEQVGLVGVRVPHLVEQADARRRARARLKGRLTRKTQRQLTWTRRPPIGGPKAAAAPPTADHRPMAAPLRCGAEGGQEQAERGGQHQGAADRLQDTGADQELERRARRRRARRRR